MNESRMTRRPIAARDTRWAAKVAARLVAMGAKPNQISVLSVVFAACAAGCLMTVPGVDSPGFKMLLHGGAALFIPLRLLCNMFDGMVAVEGGVRTRLGDLYNELPDRVSDVLVLVGAGYSVGNPTGVWLGWLCGVLAVLTAYVRAMGGVTGAVQPFCGPMAKQQRMVTVVVASILTSAGLAAGWSYPIMTVALILIAAGSAITCVRRTLAIARDLNSK